jgi:hypothetical protein
MTCVSAIAARLAPMLVAALLGMAVLGGAAHAEDPQAASTSEPAPVTAHAAPALVPAGVVGFGWG